MLHDGLVGADYDGDGDVDAFLYRWGRPKLMRNEGGLRFRDVAQEAGLGLHMNSNGATWFDADRDGDPDLYVTAYFRDDVDPWKLTTTRIMHESFEFAQNGGKNRLFENRGDGTFADVRIARAWAARAGRSWSWPPTWTATAGRTCTSRTTTAPRSCTATAATARLSWRAEWAWRRAARAACPRPWATSPARARWASTWTNISKRGYLFQGNNLRVNRLAQGGSLRNVAEGPGGRLGGWAQGAQFGDPER